MFGRSIDWRQWGLPASVIAGVVVMIVPVPAAIIDVLLANIALAIIILLTTLQVRTPLEFSLFPSILLAATLGRLVLNISTTRLILKSSGSDGIDAAGHIIQSFGSYVVGENLIIGAVIFCIIVIVQFVVVTRGATGVSESPPVLRSMECRAVKWQSTLTSARD